MLALLLVTLANPVLHSFHRSVGGFFPDAFAYLSFARRFFSTFQLYLPSWGHVDAGLLLPPAFPVLVAVAGLFTPNLAMTAEYISEISVLVTGVVLWFLVGGRRHPLAAVVIVAAVPINALYFRLGFSILTEALFVLLVGLILVTAQRSFGRDRSGALEVLLGLLCGLAFLARQIGLVLLPFVLAWVVLQAVLRGSPRLLPLRRATWVAVGFACIVLPYWAVVVAQTGHDPLRQTFRLGVYSVGIEDERDAAAAREARDARVDSYQGLLQKRRDMRRLLPDAREMLAYVLLPDPQPPGAWGMLVGSLSSPVRYLERVVRNLAHLERAVGSGLFAVFVLALVSSVAVRRSPQGVAERALVGGFVVFYVASLSVVGDQVERYVHVMIPFVVVHVGREALSVAVRSPGATASPLLQAGLGAATLLLVTGSAPARFTSVPLYPKISEAADRLAPLRRWVEPEEPMFAMHPVHPYVLQATYRVLPNDSLPKVVEYGRRTGVRWIVTSVKIGDLSDLARYSHIAWYTDERLDQTYPELVEYCCGVEDSGLRLFRIRSGPQSSRAPWHGGGELVSAAAGSRWGS